MTTVVNASELPFTVGSLSPKRIQLWAKFAGQASTGDDMSIVQGVYRGFWWELAAVESFSNVRYWFEALQANGNRDNAGRVASWMDLLADELSIAAGALSTVANLFASAEVSAPRLLNDVLEHYEALQQQLRQVRLYGTSLCQQWGFEVPEHLCEQEPSPTAPTASEV